MERISHQSQLSFLQINKSVYPVQNEMGFTIARDSDIGFTFFGIRRKKSQKKGNLKLINHQLFLNFFQNTLSLCFAGFWIASKMKTFWKTPLVCKEIWEMERSYSHSREFPGLFSLTKKYLMMEGTIVQLQLHTQAAIISFIWNRKKEGNMW